MITVMHHHARNISLSELMDFPNELVTSCECASDFILSFVCRQLALLDAFHGQ